MSTKKKSNFGDVKRARSNGATSGGYVYCILVMETHRGTELRRFHTVVDPRTLSSSDQVAFIARGLSEVGVSPDAIVDNGDGPCVALMTFDTEAECKAEYDRAVKLCNATPVAGGWS